MPDDRRQVTIRLSEADMADWTALIDDLKNRLPPHLRGPAVTARPQLLSKL